ncbi:transcription termination factor MTERF8 [Citrus sinensis]|nr:transcription termination factor MTERF8 [Citrus sinensis]
MAAAATAVTHFSSAPAYFLSQSQAILVISKEVKTRSRCFRSSTNLLTENELVTLFQEIGLNEKEVDSLLENNPTLRVTPLDKMRSRILSLQSVGIKGMAFCRLISKDSNVLLAEEIDRLICFVRDDLDGNIEPMKLERLLTSTETKFLVGFDQKVRLLLQLGVPQETILHVLNNINLSKAVCLKSVEDIERTFAYLNPFGGADLIVRCPKILNYDLDTQLIPKVRVLSELGGDDVDSTAAIVWKFPAILSYSLEHIGKHVEFLRSFAGLSDQEIFRIFLVFPAVISASRERKLRPRIDFLKQCGLGSEDIFKFLTKAPLFLALSFDNIVIKLGFLVKIGYECRTRELAAAMGSVTRTSCENLQKVIGLFLSYGLSFADIYIMSKKHPQILQYNHKSLEDKMEYLIVGMGREVGELLAFPAFLGYKLDDRIKHRYEAKRKTLGDGLSINKLLSVSVERFSTKIKKNPIHS